MSGQHVIFEGGLVKMFYFWSSKLHFWRKSRTKFELQSFDFWRKYRTKALFLSFKASFLKEDSQKSFVFELQSFNFERSLVQKLRFLSFQVWILKEVSQKGFALQLQSFNFEGSLAEKDISDLIESQTSWQPNHLNPKYFLTLKSIEFQINWQPAHLNLNQLTTKIIWITHRLTTKSFESQIRWQPNHHLTLNSFESDINWLSNQLNSTHLLPRGSLCLETSATALCGRYVIYYYTSLITQNCWSLPGFSVLEIMLQNWYTVILSRVSKDSPTWPHAGQVIMWFFHQSGILCK